jgi:large subunit ribosomal protein L9
VAAALKKAGFHIANDQVRLTGPLKELGLYTIKIHLGSNVDGEIKIWVVPSVTDDDSAGTK